MPWRRTAINGRRFRAIPSSGQTTAIARVRGTGKSRCSNCADNPFDIYAYDITTGAETLLFASGQYNAAPSIHGQYVVWQEFYEEGKSRIHLLDRGTGQQRTLAEAGRTEAMPTVSNDYVVWTVRQDLRRVRPR